MDLQSGFLAKVIIRYLNDAGTQGKAQWFCRKDFPFVQDALNTRMADCCWYVPAVEQWQNQRQAGPGCYQKTGCHHNIRPWYPRIEVDMAGDGIPTIFRVW